MRNSALVVVMGMVGCTIEHPDATGKWNGTCSFEAEGPESEEAEWAFSLELDEPDEDGGFGGTATVHTEAGDTGPFDVLGTWENGRLGPILAVAFSVDGPGVVRLSMAGGAEGDPAERVGGSCVRYFDDETMDEGGVVNLERP